MAAGPWAAHQNVEREIIFQKLVDWKQTLLMADYIGTGFPQFPCSLAQMRYSIWENNCGYILEWRNSGGMKVEKKWLEKIKGEKDGGDVYKATAKEVELRIYIGDSRPF